MAAWRYEISLLVLKKYFTCSLLLLMKYFSTLEEKFRISARPYNILCLSYLVHYKLHVHYSMIIKELNCIILKNPKVISNSQYINKLQS